VQGRIWNSHRSSIYALVSFAELMSWTGVLTANARFFCAEYTLWCIIALTWAWDSAELVHKSQRWGDLTVHSGLLLVGIGLFLFNACFEIPHFFSNYERASAGTDESGSGLWTCLQDEASPIWLKRLPFFFCYFFGCSWCSVALSYSHISASVVGQYRHASSRSTVGAAWGMACRAPSNMALAALATCNWICNCRTARRSYLGRRMRRPCGAALLTEPGYTTEAPNNWCWCNGPPWSWS
jgi:hypothetical protein